MTVFFKPRVVLAGLLAVCVYIRVNAQPEAAWGVDAGLSWAVASDAVPEWIALLRQSDVRWTRERGVWAAVNKPRAVSYELEAGNMEARPGSWLVPIEGEISSEIRGRYAAMKAAGYKIVAFAGQPGSLRPVQSGNQLPEDLRAVYAAGFVQGRDLADLVSAWELTGEPDLGYCRDLPDRLAAYNKAMYLGLHAGAREARKNAVVKWQPQAEEPVVLMGALGLAAGPWLERAAANGLLDYTDGYNFHFYGEARELTSVIAGHRTAIRALGGSDGGGGQRNAAWSWRKRGWALHAADRGAEEVRRTLPFWITECGLDAVVPGDFFNAERRAEQAAFTVETARQALAAPEVGVFMPFILVHKGDPYAMVVAQNVAPLPAWDAYARFTKDNPWPSRRVSAPAGDRASPLVLQWLPTEGSARHKVAGSYRVRDGESLAGEFRIYNFGDQAVAGRLALGDGWNWREAEGESGKRMAEDEGRKAESGKLKAETGNLKTVGGSGNRDSGRDLQVSAFSPQVSVPSSQPSGFSFQVSVSPHPASGFSARSSGLGFQSSRFISGPSGSFHVPAGGMVTVPAVFIPRRDHGYFRQEVSASLHEEGGRVSRVVFGVERVPDAGDFVFAAPHLSPVSGDGVLHPVDRWQREEPPAGPWRLFNGLAAKPADGGEGSPPAWSFAMRRPHRDPLAPSYAAAKVDGIPTDARFLRLRLDRPMKGAARVRVDLGDAAGARFTIWENLGMVYGEEQVPEVWLALEDFHPYSWSRTTTGRRRVRTEDIREIGLRFYLSGGESRTVTLDWASPKR